MYDQYDDAMRARKKKDLAESVRDAGISGALTGGAIGGIGHLLSGATSKAGVLKAALAGAGIYGGLSAGTQAIGSSIAGTPDPDDATGYTRRGALGGLIGGGIAGAGLGALAARGHIKIPGEGTLLREYFAKLAAKGEPAALRKGIVAGAVGLGGLGAYVGSDEGMQTDFVNQEEQKRRRDAIMQAMNQ